MTKPHWENLHNWRISDIRFYLKQIWEFKLMLRKHPDDSVGVEFRCVINGLKKRLAGEVISYAKIYGDKPDVVVMRREVESAKT